jgi:hypothetical protein
METATSRRWHQGDHDRRRKAGICLSCDQPSGINPRTGKAFARCLRHRQMAAASTAKYLSTARSRWRVQGCCVQCGAPCGTNPQNGKPFRNCLTHRVREAELHHAGRLKQEKHAARVLDAVPWGEMLTQQDVRQAARMDTATCGHTLKRLVEAGVLEMGEIDTGKRGRKAFTYRRRQTQERAA